MAQAVNRRTKTADERVLDAIFNPENPLGADLEVRLVGYLVFNIARPLAVV